MQRQLPMNPFPQGSMQPGNQQHSLNQLLKQSATTANISMRPPPNMPEPSYVRLMNYPSPNAIRPNPQMGFVLQHQIQPLAVAISKAHSAPQTPKITAQQLRKPSPQPSRQYLLVPRTTPKSQSGVSGQIMNQNPALSRDQKLTGHLQLGQTYKFNVERSPHFGTASGIILKHNQNQHGSLAQRIPLKAGDRGKFIPFSKLLIPGQNRGMGASGMTELHSVRSQGNQSPSQPASVLSSSGSVIMPTMASQSGNLQPISGLHVQKRGFVVRPRMSVSVRQGKQSQLGQPRVFHTGGTESAAPRYTVPKTEMKLIEHIFNQGRALGVSTHRPAKPDTGQPFDWDEYMKLTDSKPAPHLSFKHVEISLHNGFNSGMKLEVANKSDPATYWVATLVSTCGRLLLLRYDGCGDNRKTDFWVDVCTADIHPIGWCAQNGKILQPPEPIRNLHENWADFLVKNLIGARTAPERLLSGPFKGKTVVELIEPKMLLEVQDSQHPQHVWMADVIRNVGGRLLLRYKGLSDSDSKFDFWLFYLDVRLHQVGWGKEHHLTMKPPDAIRHKYNSKEHWAYVLSVSLKGVTEQDLVPACVFYDQVKLRPHELRQSMKLAVLDPINPTKIRPATVVKIVNKFFFLAELDDLESAAQTCAFLCHSGSSGVFSVNWCKKYNISITPPRGFNVLKFNWDHYLQMTGSEAVPDSCFTYMNEKHEFLAGMKLEACSPYDLYEICVATIIQVFGNVLHLRLAANDPDSGGKAGQYKGCVDCFVHSSSQDIFPVGWCDSNNYPLSAPTGWCEEKYVKDSLCKSFPNKKVAVVQPEVQMQQVREHPVSSQEVRSVINPSSSSKLWCPVVCFNSTCKSGVFVNDHALSKVPKFVGPGNTALVIREVLSLLVGAAERPHKLLKDLEDFTVGRGNQPCVIKAKFEGKKYQATLHIVDSAAQVPGYFAALARFLKCCPNLLTLENPVTECPLKCTQVRTVGRPPSMRQPNAQRARKRKLIMNRVGHEQFMAFSKPQSRSTIKGTFRGSAAHRMILQNRLGRGSQRYDGPGGVASLVSDACEKLKRSVGCLAMYDKDTINKRLKKRQERLKLHKLALQSNPLHWTVDEVVGYIESTDCAEFSCLFLQQQIDGQALLLLTLPVVQEFMDLKLGPALKVSRNVERVKMAFYENFAAA